MNYESLNNQLIRVNFEKKYFLSIFGIYFFSLGSTILGYSTYLLLEGIGIVEKSVTTWSGQSLFWFLIFFCVSIFILFIPVEFFEIFKIYNSTFKDLILNIVIVIFISLVSLVLFQFFLNPNNAVLRDVIEIGKSISFAGFIAIPLLFFLEHNLNKTIRLSENTTYSIVILFWILTSNLFL